MAEPWKDRVPSAKYPDPGVMMPRMSYLTLHGGKAYFVGVEWWGMKEGGVVL